MQWMYTNFSNTLSKPLELSDCFYINLHIFTSLQILIHEDKPVLQFSMVLGSRLLKKTITF